MRGISSIAKADDAGLRDRLDRVGMAVGIHVATMSAPVLSGGDLLRVGPAHLEHDVGAERLGRGYEPRAGGLVVGVGDAGLTPAPRSTATSAPRPMNFLTVSGVAATRVSAGSVSAATPISMKPSPRPS